MQASRAPAERSEMIPVVVSGKNLTVTEGLRRHVEKELQRIAERFAGHPAKLHVVLSVRRNQHVAEVTLSIGGFLIRAEAASSDMYQSVAEARRRVADQLRRFKTRLLEGKRATIRRPVGASGAPSATASTLELAAGRAGTNAGEADDAEEEPSVDRIVRVKRFALRPMTVEDALLQMELLGHSFFLFLDATSGTVKALYRRDDGRFGLLEPLVEA